MKKLLSLLLAMIMVIGLIPTTVFAVEPEAALPFALTYVTGDSSEAKTADASVIGSYAQGEETGKVYLVSLPAGSQVQEFTPPANNMNTTYGSTLSSFSGSLDAIRESYVVDAEMLSPLEGTSYATMYNYCTFDSANVLKGETVRGFAIYARDYAYLQTGTIVFVQIDDTPAPSNNEFVPGTTDTSWYTPGQISYTITTAEQLRGLLLSW